MELTTVQVLIAHKYAIPPGNRKRPRSYAGGKSLKSKIREFINRRKS